MEGSWRVGKGRAERNERGVGNKYEKKPTKIDRCPARFRPISLNLPAFYKLYRIGKPAA
jgi:hypothetical protein